MRWLPVLGVKSNSPVVLKEVNDALCKIFSGGFFKLIIDNIFQKAYYQTQEEDVSKLHLYEQKYIVYNDGSGLVN